MTIEDLRKVQAPNAFCRYIVRKVEGVQGAVQSVVVQEHPNHIQNKIHAESYEINCGSQMLKNMKLSRTTFGFNNRILF